MLFRLGCREKEQIIYKLIDQLKSQLNIFNIFYHTGLNSVKYGNIKNAYNLFKRIKVVCPLCCNMHVLL